MSRRKFRHTQKFESAGERSFQEYLLNQPAPQTTRAELLRLVRGGEDTYLELKVKLSNSERIAQEIVALANTAGGTIIFGVTDQLRVEGVFNPEAVQTELVRICREEIYPPLVPLLDCLAFDNGKYIVALDIDGRNPPYRTKDGRFYIRFGAEKREIRRDELSGWLGEIRPLFYENIPVPQASDADFDDALLWSFAAAFDDDALGGNMYQTADFLKKDLLLGVGSQDEFVPTVAAILLFGKNERVSELLPFSTITAARYSGDKQLVESIELKGNLHTLFESAMNFVNRYCDLWNHKPKSPKLKLATNEVPRGNYHLYSIREAIINALIHRDLAIRDIPTKFTIYDDAIEITNPRRTKGFAPPASRAIRYGITQRVNPQIAAIFLRREYGLQVPHGGLPMILRQSRLFSGRRVEMLTGNDEFKLKIFAS